jgi:lipoate-protein ligase A
MSKVWRLVDLGPVDGYTMTNVYEAVAISVSREESANTVIFNHPSSPFVNIGYHQIMEKEIDVEYSKEMGFDLVRRTIGGGAILDGNWEQDYFVIVDKYSEDCPATIPDFYQHFLKPPIYALRKMGLKAEFRPPNDILVNGRKISGNGAITVESSNVLAGDLLLDVPSELMTRIIRAPDEKFQDKLAETMAQWLTSIRKELGEDVERSTVKQHLIEGYDKELDISLESGLLTKDERICLQSLVDERRRDDWIFGKDLVYRDLLSGEKARKAKVRSGVIVSEAVHKANKMIRVTLVAEEGAVGGISISGDFFTQPYVGAIASLEEALQGTPLNEDALKEKVGEAFEELGLVLLGATQKDIVTAIMKAKVEES